MEPHGQTRGPHLAITLRRDYAAVIHHIMGDITPKLKNMHLSTYKPAVFCEGGLTFDTLTEAMRRGTNLFITDLKKAEISTPDKYQKSYLNPGYFHENLNLPD